MIEQASLVIGEGNWAVKSDSLLGYKINGGKYYPREMSVVRATTGTRINEDGLVELVPYNLYSKSNDFSTWGNIVNVTVTPNYTTSPEGTQNASRFQALAYGFIFNLGTTATVGEPITISVYAKRNDSGTQSVGFFQGDSAIEYAFSLTNEWQRFEYTTNFLNDYIGIAANSGADISIYGFQIVQGSTALDYLPTTDRLDVARIDYSSGSGALLVEPQRTNLVTYSSSFDNSAWNKTNCSITANNTTAPDGTTAADKLILANGQSGSSSDGTGIRQLVDIASGSYTYSIYAKAAEFTTIRFRENQVTGAFLTIDLTNGAITNGDAGQYINPTAILVSNGWYRITFQTPTLTALYKYSVRVSETGNGTSGIFIWGYQVELGSYSTSYIPTQSATVTRNADVISKTGIADLIGQTEGTLFVEFINDNNNNASIDRIVALSDGTANNRLYLAKLLSGASYFVSVTSGTQTGGITGAIMPQGIVKIALAYNTNDVVMYVNGSLVGSDLFHTTPATSNLYLGQENLGTASLYKPYNAVSLYKTRLTNAELATLTTI